MIHGNDHIHDALEKVAGVRRGDRLLKSIQKTTDPEKLQRLMTAYRSNQKKGMRSLIADKTTPMPLGGYGTGIGTPFGPKLSARGKRMARMTSGKELRYKTDPEKVMKGRGFSENMSEGRFNRKFYDMFAGTDARSARVLKDIADKAKTTNRYKDLRIAEYTKRGIGHPANPPRIRALVGK